VFKDGKHTMEVTVEQHKGKPAKVGRHLPKKPDKAKKSKVYFNEAVNKIGTVRVRDRGDRGELPLASLFVNQRQRASMDPNRITEPKENKSKVAAEIMVAVAKALANNEIDTTQLYTKRDELIEKKGVQYEEAQNSKAKAMKAMKVAKAKAKAKMQTKKRTPQKEQPMKAMKVAKAKAKMQTKKRKKADEESCKESDSHHESSSDTTVDSMDSEDYHKIEFDHIGSQMDEEQFGAEE
jgi:hypothetical protein